MPDVTLKPPARPRTSQSPSYADVSPRLPPHLLMGKLKKKSQSPSMARCYPSSPKAKAFLLFRVWLQTFLPASSKSNNRPSVPWEHRGGRARWERGIRHTSTHKRPAGGKRKRAGRGQKDGEKEEEESAFERCFSASRRGPSLCEKRQGEKKHNSRSERRRGRKTCHVFYQTWRLRECV